MLKLPHERDLFHCHYQLRSREAIDLKFSVRLSVYVFFWYDIGRRVSGVIPKEGIGWVVVQ